MYATAALELMKPTYELYVANANEGPKPTTKKIAKKKRSAVYSSIGDEI